MILVIRSMEKKIKLWLKLGKEKNMQFCFCSYVCFQYFLTAITVSGVLQTQISLRDITISEYQECKFSQTFVFCKVVSNIDFCLKETFGKILWPVLEKYKYLANHPTMAASSPFLVFFLNHFSHYCGLPFTKIINILRAALEL